MSTRPLLFAFALCACSRGAEPASSPTASTAATTATADATAPPSADTAPAATPDTAPAAPDAVPDATAENWTRFAPPHEGFAVDLPAAPERVLKPVAGPQGHSAQVIQYNVTIDDYALVVSASPLVAQLVQHGDTNLALERALAGQIELPGRTLRYKKPVTLGDAKGLEAEVDLEIEGHPLDQATGSRVLDAAPRSRAQEERDQDPRNLSEVIQKMRLRMRLYLVELRMYQVLGLWPVPPAALPGAPEPAAPPTLERFFSSFSLEGDATAVGAAIDLWQDFPLAPFGLTAKLPKAPEIATETSDTFTGSTEVIGATSLTSFPMSIYTLESAEIPDDWTAKKPAALLDAWEKARRELSKSDPAGGSPTVVAASPGALLGLDGRTLDVRLHPTEGAEKHGLMRAVVVMKDGTPDRLLIATVWVDDPKELPEASTRFFEGLRLDLR